MPKPKTYVVLSDIQFPFHDPKALNLALAFIDDLKPHGVVLAGDIADCYSLSSFDKSPLTAASLELEIQLTRGLMERLSKVTRERVFLGGNHEARLTAHLWRNPQLWRELDPASRKRIAKALDFPTVFGLADYGFSWRPYGGVYKLGKLTVTHGSIVRQDSGASAKAHLLKYGGSVLHGHTHRGGSYFRRNGTGVFVAYENFCLCKLSPEYAQMPDWSQGFSVVHVGKNGLFNVQQIPILPGYQLFYGDRHFA